jgi:hypothetical protein
MNHREFIAQARISVAALGVNYFPEKKTNPDGVALQGTNPGGNHMGNWFACIRDRRQPNANVEIGYLAAVACHMSNLAYKERCRVYAGRSYGGKAGSVDVGITARQ